MGRRRKEKDRDFGAVSWAASATAPSFVHTLDYMSWCPERSISSPLVPLLPGLLVIGAVFERRAAS